MSAKHTPGPWAVNPKVAQVDAFSTGRPLPVCAVLWPTEERTEAETEANAWLIAAAPNLLDQLAELVADVEYVQSWESPSSRLRHIDLEPASDAIKRARGLA